MTCAPQTELHMMLVAVVMITLSGIAVYCYLEVTSSWAEKYSYVKQRNYYLVMVICGGLPLIKMVDFLFS